MAHDGIHRRPKRRAWASAQERNDAVERLLERRGPLTPEELALFHEIYPSLLKAHRPRIWRVLSKSGLQAQTAADLYQDTTLTFFSKVVTEGFPKDIGAYLKGIVNNKVMHAVRDLVLDPVSVGLPSSGAEKPRSSQPNVEQIVADCELGKRILPRLSTEHQQVLVTVDLHRLTTKQASELLGIPEGTVKTRLTAARKAFYVLVEPYLTPSQKGQR